MTFAARCAFRVFLFAVFAAVFAAPSLFAQNQSVEFQGRPAPPDLKVFASQYVLAMNSKDPARLRAMYTAKSIACITPQNKDYYDAITSMSMRDSIPANYTLWLFPIDQNNLKAIEAGYTFPVPPERELHIDSQQGEDSASVVIWVVRENGRWMSDFPCATDATIKDFRDSASARAELNAKSKALADGIKEPLRSELIGLLRAHETGRATERYREASKQDGRMSMLVMAALKDEMR